MAACAGPPLVYDSVAKSFTTPLMGLHLLRAQVQVGDSVWLQPPWAPGALAQGQVAAVATVAAAGRVLPLTLQAAPSPHV